MCRKSIRWRSDDRHRDAESGQAVTEYIVMLAIIVMIAVGAFRALRPIFDDLSQSAGETLKNRLSRGLHQIRISR